MENDRLGVENFLPVGLTYLFLLLPCADVLFSLLCALFSIELLPVLELKTWQMCVNLLLLEPTSEVAFEKSVLLLKFAAFRLEDKTLGKLFARDLAVFVLDWADLVAAENAAANGLDREVIVEVILIDFGIIRFKKLCSYAKK